MIDAIDLIFAEHCFDLPVQRLRRIEIIAERLLDDDSPPATVFLASEFSAPEFLNDGTEELRRSREIEQIVSASVELLINLAEPQPYRRECCGIAKISTLVIKTLLEPVPRVSSAVFGRQK